MEEQVTNSPIAVSDAQVSVDLTKFSDAEMRKYTEIARSLNEKDMTSVSSYGSELQHAMNTYSNSFLEQQMSSKISTETSKLISDLLGEIKTVDIDDFEQPTVIQRILRKIPVLRSLVTSVEQLKTKYNTIQENIDAITKKLEATKQIAIRDNNLLQKLFENNCDYVDQLEELIIGGHIKSKELETKISEMQANASNYNEYEISDLAEYKDALDKRITDLTMLRYAFKQTLMQIRIIQRTNMMDATNTEAQITMTIPLWKNQLSTAVALYNQKQSIDIKNKVSDATNKILSKNAEMMKMQAIDVAKQNQRSVIDIETLRKTTEDLLATVAGVQQVQKEYAAKRASAEAEIYKLERDMATKALGIAESTSHVIAKELTDRQAQTEVLSYSQK